MNRNKHNQTRQSPSRQTPDHWERLNLDLRESSGCFRQLAEHMQDVFFLYDWPGRKLLYVTPSYKHFWGGKAEDAYLHPHRWIASLHPEDQQRVDRVLTDPHIELPVDMEFHLPDPNCSIRWIRDRWFPIKDNKEQIHRIIHQITDITECKEAQEQLAASETRFRGTFEQAAVGMAHLNRFGICQRVNQRLCRILGTSAETLMNRIMQDWIEPSDLDASPNEPLWRRLWQEDIPSYSLQKQLQCDNGENVWVQITISRVHTPEQETDYAMLVIQDIGQRKAHEQRVNEYQQQLKALASEMTLAEERLKTQVATQLHDTVSQSLALSKLKLECLQQEVSDDEVFDSLTAVCETLNEALQMSRTLTSQMSYPLLGVLGLEKAIEKWLEDEIAPNSPIQTHFTRDPEDNPLTEDLRLVLFRSVRELLNNTLKHARATEVRVAIEHREDRIVITVTDNGLGCEADKALGKGGGFGLLSIQEALERLGGSLRLTSHPGAGCQVTLHAPLDLIPA